LGPNDNFFLIVNGCVTVKELPDNKLIDIAYGGEMITGATLTSKISYTTRRDTQVAEFSSESWDYIANSKSMVRFVRENTEQTKERIKKDEFGFRTTVVLGKNVNKSTIISNLGAAAH
jgi:hypothetical protein